MEDDNRVSITICGDGGCGKSSITLRLVRSQWIEEYDPTIEDSYSVTRSIDGRPYFLSLTDTAGQEEYRGLWAASNLRSDAFLLVYDITQPSSLPALDYFLQMIDMESDHRADSGAVAPVKLVAGNKCDLKEMRAVSARDGLEWARGKGCGFMETSAREMVNIEETFALIVRRVIAARQAHAQSKQTKVSPAKSSNKLGLFHHSPSSNRLQASPGSPHLYDKEGENLGGAANFMDTGRSKKKGRGKGLWGWMRCW